MDEGEKGINRNTKIKKQKSKDKTTNKGQIRQLYKSKNKARLRNFKGMGLLGIW
jgi:hypothetical protein